MLNLHFYPDVITYSDIRPFDSWQGVGKTHGGYAFSPCDMWHWAVGEHKQGTSLSISYSSDLKWLNYLKELMATESGGLDYAWVRASGDWQSTTYLWRSVLGIPPQGCSLEWAIQCLLETMATEVSQNWALQQVKLPGKGNIFEAQKRMQKKVYTLCMAHVPLELLRETCEPFLQGGSSC
jgi:hypothetical protein